MSPLAGSANVDLRIPVPPLLIIALLAACADSSGATAPVTTETPATETTGGGEAPTQTAEDRFLDKYVPEAGDCVDFDSDGQVIEQRCTEAHDAEVAAVVPYVGDSGDAFPGEPTLEDFALRTCLRQYESYVGVDYAHSGLRWDAQWPQADAWEAGYRVVWCLVQDLAGVPLTTVVRDSGGVRHPGLVLAANLEPGMCLNDGHDEGLYPALSCSDPHDLEVFAVLSHTAGADEPFPGEDAMSEFGEGCAAAFEDYVGLSFIDSSLGIAFDYPHQDHWIGGQRTIGCFLASGSGGTLDGSMRRTGHLTALYPAEPGSHEFVLDDLPYLSLRADEAPAGTVLLFEHTFSRDEIIDMVGAFKGMPSANHVVVFGSPELDLRSPGASAPPEAIAIRIQAELFASSGVASRFFGFYETVGANSEIVDGFDVGDESIAMAASQPIHDLVLAPGIEAVWRLDNLVVLMDASGADVGVDFMQRLAETLHSRAVERRASGG